MSLADGFLTCTKMVSPPVHLPPVSSVTPAARNARMHCIRSPWMSPTAPHQPPPPQRLVRPRWVGLGQTAGVAVWLSWCHAVGYSKVSAATVSPIATQTRSSRPQRPGREERTQVGRVRVRTGYYPPALGVHNGRRTGLGFRRRRGRQRHGLGRHLCQHTAAPRQHPVGGCGRLSSSSSACCARSRQTPLQCFMNQHGPPDTEPNAPSTGVGGWVWGKRRWQAPPDRPGIHEAEGYAT